MGLRPGQAKGPWVGTPGIGNFTRDEFWVTLESDTATFDLSTPKNAFKNAAQTASKMVVQYDKSGVVDVANAKVILTEGTWELGYFVSADLVVADWMLARIHEDPDGANTHIFSGTLAWKASLDESAATVTCQIKVQAGDEFGFFVVGNSASETLRGGNPPALTYAYGRRINADATP